MDAPGRTRNERRKHDHPAPTVAAGDGESSVPLASLRTLGQALLEHGAEVKLPAGAELRVVTAAQAALLEFLAAHPFCTIESLDVHNGDPVLAKLRLNEVVAEKIRLGGSR